MKKKRLLTVTICLLLIGFGITLFSFETLSVEREIRVSSPISYVANQFTNLKNWKNWYPDLIKGDSTLFTYSDTAAQVNSFLRTPRENYTIVKTDPASVVVRDDHNGKKTYHNISAFPDSFGMATKVRWVEFLSPLDWILSKNKTADEMQEGLYTMKTYAENSKNRYGFRIEIRPMADSIILFRETDVLKNDKMTTLRKLYKDLLRYGQINNIDITGPRLATFTLNGTDSLHIIAGISVNRKGPLANGIRFANFPKQGRAVVVEYNGAYAGVERIYPAVEKYITDKNLKRVTAPFEKYFNNPITAEDSAHMRVELHYPVL